MEKPLIDKLIDLDVALNNIGITDMKTLCDVIPRKKVNTYTDAISLLSFLSADYDYYRTKKQENKSIQQVKYSKLFA